MRTIKLGRTCLGVGTLWLGACSAGSPPPDGSGIGTGGINASGGTPSVGGVGASGGSGGTGGSIGSGSGGTISVGGSSASGGSAGVAICQELNVVPTPQVPTVAIVVDNSSSMYEPREELFDRLYDALMNPTTGAIQPLQDKVRFGFSSFRSPDETSVPEADNACAQITAVPYALGNFDAIDAVYQGVGLDGRRPLGCGATPNEPNCGETDWETPTGHSLSRVAADLAAFQADPPGRKYMLFVTDGTPNTCLVANPNCGQDLAINAVQDAYAANIGTLVIGIGRITQEDQQAAGCQPTSMRCGADHLQDIANAGVGQPVAPPPMGYWYEQCAVRHNAGTSNQGTPEATYAATVAEQGTAPYYTATSATELQTALSALLSDVISCTVEMDAVVTGDPAVGMVTVGGSPVAYNDPNGWTLDMTTKYNVTLTGSACDTFKGGATLDIKFPCDVMGNPVAEPR